MEIALHHPALIDSDVAVQQGREPIQHPAFDLRDQAVRVDHQPGVDRRDQPAHRDRTIGVHRHFGHHSQIRPERLDNRHAAPGARRQGRAPSRLFRRQLQHRRRARFITEHRQPEGDRVHAGLCRQLVDETFDRIKRVVWSDAAPIADIHRDWLGPHIGHALMRNVVQKLGRPLDIAAIEPIL